VLGAPGGDGLAEVTVLVLDDLVRVVTDVGELARSSQLVAGHRLHLGFLSSGLVEVIVILSD
jgi:hypothetical protein